jgi:ABC-type uncharacterized transport system permease subunit
LEEAARGRGMMESDTAIFISTLIGTSIRLSTPLVLAALGGLYAERTGLVLSILHLKE